MSHRTHAPAPTRSPTATDPGGVSVATWRRCARDGAGAGAGPWPQFTGSGTGAAGGVAPLPGGAEAARHTALLPADLLHEGEIIVLLLKPALVSVLLEPLGQLLAMLGLTALAVGVAWQADLAPLTPERALLLGVGLTLLRIGGQFLLWLSRLYVLTDRRVVRMTGVLRLAIFEARLSQIQHTSVGVSLRQRMVGAGDIHFATAGTGTPEAAWRWVARPMDVHRTVVRTMDRYG